MTETNSDITLKKRFSLEGITNGIKELHYRYPIDFFGWENDANVRLARSVVENKESVVKTLKNMFLEEGIGVPYYILFRAYEKKVASRSSNWNSAYDLFRNFFEMIVGLHEDVSDMIVNGYASENGIKTPEIQQDRPLDFKPEQIVELAERLAEQVSKGMPKAEYNSSPKDENENSDIVDAFMRFFQRTLNEDRRLRYACGAATLMSILPIVISTSPAYAQVQIRTKGQSEEVKHMVFEKPSAEEKSKSYTYVELTFDKSVESTLEKHNIPATFAEKVKSLQKYFPSSRNIFSEHRLWKGKKYVVDKDGSKSIFLPEKFLNDAKIPFENLEDNADVVFRTRKIFPGGIEQYITHKLNAETGEYTRVEGEKKPFKKISLKAADAEARNVVLNAVAKGIITSVPKSVLEEITRKRWLEPIELEEKAEKVGERYQKQQIAKEDSVVYADFVKKGKASSETIDSFIARLNDNQNGVFKNSFLELTEEDPAVQDKRYEQAKQEMFSRQLRVAGLETKIAPELTDGKKNYETSAKSENKTSNKSRESLYERARLKLDAYRAIQTGFVDAEGEVTKEKFKLDRCYIGALNDDEKMRIVDFYNNRNYKTVEEVIEAAKEDIGIKKMSKASLYKILKQQKCLGKPVDFRSEKFQLDENQKVKEIARFYRTSPEIIRKVLYHCKKHDVNPYWIIPLINQESGFNPRATSYAGAMGLMQLMPGTAKSLGVKNPYSVDQNLDGGIRYFKQQFNKFGSITKVLAAYNAGPGAVEMYNGVPPYSETINYVDSISGGSRNFMKWMNKRTYHLKMADENKEL